MHERVQGVHFLLTGRVVGGQVAWQTVPKRLRVRQDLHVVLSLTHVAQSGVHGCAMPPIST